jgi:hypothetical protein
MMPSIHFEERPDDDLEDYMPLRCIVCKSKRGIAWYCDEEWRKNGEDRACEACLRDMTKPCSICKVEKKYSCFLLDEWDKQQPDEQDRRQCNKCLRISAPGATPNSKRPADGEVSSAADTSSNDDDLEDTSNKKPKLVVPSSTHGVHD